MIRDIMSFFASPVYAQVTEAPKLEQLFTSFDGILDMIFPIAGLIAVGMIIYGGYMWIISGGDPSKKQVAQGTLTWAVLGLVFLYLIKALLDILINFITG